MLLNNQWITEKNQIGNQKIFVDKWKWNTTQSLWDTRKVLWRLKFIVKQAYQMVITAMKLKDTCSLEGKP